MALFISWGTPHNDHDLYGEAPRERGTFIMLQVYKRVEILLGEVYERVGKCVIVRSYIFFHLYCYLEIVVNIFRSIDLFYTY